MRDTWIILFMLSRVDKLWKIVENIEMKTSE